MTNNTFKYHVKQSIIMTKIDKKYLCHYLPYIDKRQTNLPTLKGWIGQRYRKMKKTLIEKMSTF